MTAPVVVAKPEPIAMTAPVVVDSKQKGLKKMSFILPCIYTINTAPIPDDPRVKLEAVPGKVVAVRTFSGTHDYDDRTQLNALLNDLANDEDYEPILDSNKEPKFSLAYYNPPFALPWLRTNEVMVDVEDKKKS